MDVGRSHLRSPFFSRSSFTALLRLFIFSSFLPLLFFFRDGGRKAERSVGHKAGSGAADVSNGSSRGTRRHRQIRTCEYYCSRSTLSYKFTLEYRSPHGYGAVATFRCHLINMNLWM
jgi:hypothetical protein